MQVIQWGNAHGLRTTMLLSPYPWPTNSAGQLDTFRQFTGNTFARDTLDFVHRLKEGRAIPTEWVVDNYEDTYPHDAPAMVPETVLNTATEVGLWLVENAPVYAHGDNAEGPAPRTQSRKRNSHKGTDGEDPSKQTQQTHRWRNQTISSFDRPL